jgi:HlyD family secretion protein
MNGNKQDDSSAALNRPRVWVVRNNEPVAIPVSVGSTDGHFTEVKSGDVTPGMPLIVEALKESK